LFIRSDVDYYSSLYLRPGNKVLHAAEVAVPSFVMIINEEVSKIHRNRARKTIKSKGKVVLDFTFVDYKIPQI
jgi:hypothetical protein